MDNSSFADGLGMVTVIGTTVRLDFVIYEPDRKDRKNAPSAQFQHRVIMSLEGFKQSVEKMNETAKALAQLGQQTQQQPEPSGKTVQNGAGAKPAAPGAPAKPAKRPFP